MNTPISDYSVFEYLYRDASNFKAWGQLLLKGLWTEECQRELEACIGDGFLSPSKLGFRRIMRNCTSILVDTARRTTMRSTKLIA
jgi:hypothetical protein